MEDLSAHMILYIEPSNSVSADPVIDRLTRKMAAALRRGDAGPRYHGFHICACGVFSSNRDYTLPSKQQTNSLAVHYLAWHRNEVPQSELDKVSALDCGEAEPTDDELARPADRP